MIAYLVYCLCMLASTLCAVALGIQFKRSGGRLLFWSAICFVGFAVNNLLLVLDYYAGPKIDLSIVRTLPALFGLATMILAFIWESV